MEAQINGEAHQLYGSRASELNGVGKKNTEWDLNGWKWDGDLLVATPLNPAPSSCRNKQLFPAPAVGLSNSSSSSHSDNVDPVSNGKGKWAPEKRRRDMVVIEEDGPDEEAGSLTLKLGGHDYPIAEADLANWDGTNGKRGKLLGGNSNRTTCQVEGCSADLSDAKDYHRRHKVCEMHAKASKALVGNVMQRFCQQCSRFHLLQEFDEGKRSCRRRLAGHNRRRRKTHPDVVVDGNSLVDDRASLLISFLRILSNSPSAADSSGQPKNQDLLAHFLGNLASLAGSFDARSILGLLQASQDLQKSGTSGGTSSEAAHALISNCVTAHESSKPLCSTSKVNCITETQDSPVRLIDQSASVAIAGVPQKRNLRDLGENLLVAPSERLIDHVPIEDCVPSRAEDLYLLQQVSPAESTMETVKFRNIDLNNTYDDGQDIIEGLEKPVTPANNLQLNSLHCSSLGHVNCCQASPPQNSGNSDSASGQTNSSSNGDVKSRTDKIVFKLFGKVPSDFPPVLRAQILNWLSNAPTDIEGYIRPGCIILTIYLHLPESTWEEICFNLSSSLKRLLDLAGDEFWRTGWIYTRVQHQIAFIYDGYVVLDTPSCHTNHSQFKISSVTPIAVSISGRVTFKLKGYNVARSSCRLLCAFEGKYLVEETTQTLMDDTGIVNEHDGLQCLSFSCSLPGTTGRGFIEVEDNGLNSDFFPFIVADEDVSSEICMLESTINMVHSHDQCHDKTTATKARTHALDFLHEMGWLLRRSYLRSGSEHPTSRLTVFPLKRFRWLMDFSMDQNWCAVVKKLLDILFGGFIDVGEHSVEFVLSEMALLHSAVQKNCRPLVELLLRYVPDKVSAKRSQNVQVEPCPKSYIFRPDMLGPFDMTPLHVAASRGGSESMLDALTDDPCQVGVKAWKTVRDSTGFTPEDYALSRGYASYIRLVQNKINQMSGAAYVVVDIPESSLDLDVSLKQADKPSSGKTTGLEIDRRRVRPTLQPSCRLCTQQVAYGAVTRTLRYRPTMFFMVGIAAVCVCVSLLLKSPPEVFSVFPPFRWELLGYGYM